MKQILQLGLYLFFCLGLAQNTLAQGDNCNNAEVINALPFQDNGTTDGFSNDYDATCSTSGDPFAPDVVYRYTAPSNGFINISLCETGGITDFDTELWVYEGTCSTMNEVACSGDACNNGNLASDVISRITNMPVTAGQTYFIVIGGFTEFDFGNFTINVTDATPVAGTDCSNPLVINSLPFTQTENTATFGDAIDVTACSNNNYIAGDEVVYTYTPGNNEFVDIAVTNISTSGAIMITDDCPNAVGAQCVAEVFGQGSSSTLNITSLELIGGQTYYIVISTFPSPQSTDFTFNITGGSPPPVGSDCAAPIVIPSIPFQDLGQSTVAFGDNYDNSPCNPVGTDYMGGNEIVYTFTATEDRVVGILLTNISDILTSVHVLDACPDVATSCIGFASNVNATDDLELNIDVVNGETYYIVVSTWPNPQSTSFDLIIEEPSGVNISVNPNEGSESDQTIFTITATSGTAVNSDQTVDVQVVGNGITLADFVLSASQITIPSGQTSGSITLTIQDDALGEGTETAFISLINPSAGITLGNFIQESITILDNDNQVNLSIAKNSTLESSQETILLTVNATDPVSGDQTMDLTFSGEGIDENDFLLSSSQFLIADGTQSAQITVQIKNDVFGEGNETVTFSLTNPSALIGIGANNSQMLEIIDDDFVPVSVDDNYIVDEDTELSVDAPGILSNDTDADLDVLSANMMSDVSQGTLKLAADGTFTYTPATDFSGTDSFTYVANDGFNNSSLATVTFQINPVNDAPTMTRNLTLAIVPEASQVAIGSDLLQFSDIEDDNTTLVYTIRSLPTQGVLTLNGVRLAINNTFTQADIDQNLLRYSHQGTSSGFDDFNFVVSDSENLESEEATFFVLIDVVSANEDNILKQGTQIWPNPGIEDYFIRLENTLRGDLKVNIIDVQGKTIRNYQYQKTANIFEVDFDLKGEAPGLYLLKLELDERVAFFRLMKE